MSVCVCVVRVFGVTILLIFQNICTWWPGEERKVEERKLYTTNKCLSEQVD